MVVPRWNHAATLLANGKVLVASGYATDRATAELYDPGTGRWTATGSMTMAHSYFTATLLPDGRVLAVGGYGLEKATAELYDPGSGQWTATGTMAEAHHFHTATPLPDGRVLVVGGYGNDGDTCCVATSTAELYDPFSGTWTIASSTAAARQGHSATLLPDGRVLVAGGLDSGGDGPLASAELYDPKSGRWTATGSLAEARSAFTATLLGDGTVLVTGGRGAGGDDDSLASVELYDPSTGRWTAIGSMAEARSNVHCGWFSCGHTATLMPDGRVLVAGGGNDPSRVQGLASAELYDPSSGRWTPTASMRVARVGFTTTLLPDGSVLAAGGDFSGGPDDLATAEIYDPTGGFSDDEANLLAVIRADARVACEPRRVDLPPRAIAGVECTPNTALVARVGAYLFRGDRDAETTYLEKLAEYGVRPLTGDCQAGTAGDSSWTRDDGPTDSTPRRGRHGCFLNEDGIANYRATCAGNTYVGILGKNKDLKALFQWATRFPGGPEGGMPSAPGICLGRALSPEAP
jgi:hypothetical protein